MIRDNELSVIGRTLKPHGINGEISATVDSDVDLDDLRCIVLDIDGIYVPFFINSYRSRGSEAVLITIDGIKDENQAAAVCGLDIHALKSDLGEQGSLDGDDGFYMSDLIGFKLLDQAGHTVGTISGYDDSTANTLLIVDNEEGESIYVPIADELINDFDAEARVISINVPEGLLEL